MVNIYRTQICRFNQPTGSISQLSTDKVLSPHTPHTYIHYQMYLMPPWEKLLFTMLLSNPLHFYSNLGWITGLFPNEIPARSTVQWFGLMLTPCPTSVNSTKGAPHSVARLRHYNDIHFYPEQFPFKSPDNCICFRTRSNQVLPKQHKFGNHV